MSATVIPFRRDFKKALAALIDISPAVTEAELHSRLEKLRKLCSEAYSQRDEGIVETTEITLIMNAINALHTIAVNAGADRKIAAAFAENRADWKEFRAALRPCRRL